MHKKGILISCCIAFAFLCNAQNDLLFNKTNQILQDYPEKSFSRHATLLPYNELHNNDSVSISHYLQPIYSSEFYYNIKGKNISSFSLGGQYNYTIGNRWKGKLALLGRSNTYFTETEKRIDSLSFIPNGGHNFEKGIKGYSWLDLRGQLQFKVTQHLVLNTGYGKHFQGSGYRSLFFSDNSGAYPYFQTSLKIWHLHYINTILFLSDYYVDNELEQSYKRKYATIHNISWNITPSFNVNFFESVVWRRADSAIHKGFEINYLNPVVFMRPLEYAEGSTGNALLGLGFNLHLFKRVMAYSQFLLDELFSPEFFSNPNYRDNKYAIQLGLSGYNFFDKKIKWRIENNIARPFTYSHYSTLQNYGHQHQPLAHPFGANFVEYLGQLSWHNKKWYTTVFSSFYKRGLDQPEQQVGSDIYKNFWDVEDRDNHPLLNGLPQKGLIFSLKAGYLIKPEWNMVGEAGIVYKMENTDGDIIKFPMLNIGIKTLLYHQDRFAQ